MANPVFNSWYRFKFFSATKLVSENLKDFVLTVLLAYLQIPGFVQITYVKNNRQK